MINVLNTKHKFNFFLSIPMIICMYEFRLRVQKKTFPKFISLISFIEILLQSLTQTLLRKIRSHLIYYSKTGKQRTEYNSSLHRAITTNNNSFLENRFIALIYNILITFDCSKIINLSKLNNYLLLNSYCNSQLEFQFNLKIFFPVTPLSENDIFQNIRTR